MKHKDMTSGQVNLLDVHDSIIEHVPELIPVHNDAFPEKNIVLLGTFKAWERIKATREQFRQLGFWVLAPEGDEITHYAETFEVLDGDAHKLALLEQRLGAQLSEREAATFLEALFLHAIEASDLCYVVGMERSDVDDGTYIGDTVSLEIGWALGCNKPVYVSRAISPTLDEREGNYSMFRYYAGTLPTAEPWQLANPSMLPHQTPWTQSPGG